MSLPKNQNPQKIPVSLSHNALKEAADAAEKVECTLSHLARAKCFSPTCLVIVIFRRREGERLGLKREVMSRNFRVIKNTWDTMSLIECYEHVIV